VTFQGATVQKGQFIMAKTVPGGTFISLRALYQAALIATFALLCWAPGSAGAPPPLGAPEKAPQKIRLGLLKFGTASWSAEIVAQHGLDRTNGFELERVELASNEAARIAFVAGDVDMIVSDLLFAARLTAEGRPAVFIPFSTAESALVAPSGSPIRSIADLKGRRIGVSGGPLDKAWLLLRAQAQRAYGLDLTRDATPVFGAPPLLQQKLEAGEADAALLYWNYAARLKAKGYREVTSVESLMRDLGANGNVAMIGFIVRSDFADAHEKAVDGFAAAIRSAGDILASGGKEWDSVRPLMRAEDEATFRALKQGFLAGRPQRPVADEEADARQLYDILVRVGGEKLVGPAKELPRRLYLRGDGDVF
jgi:NitT/TauT family transport system substrate-binding protein